MQIRDKNFVSTYIKITGEEINFVCFIGEIIITNWKPLNIEAICHEDGSKTVGDIFRQISTVPTLKLTLR